MMTIDDIRKMIDQQGVMPDFTNNATTGTVKRGIGGDADYEIFVGWDIAKANQCDSMWGIFNTNLVQFIRNQNYSQEELDNIQSYIQLGDSHWDWLWKSCAHRGNEYEWFYLYADDKPQAACLIYHPKKSVLHEEDIFYIEYIAVAPWNRKNPMQERELVGLGKAMIQFVINYATKTLGLHLGFSLHSVPTATGFYEGLGMLSFEQNDKGELKFYEMPSQVADRYLEAS